MGGGFVHLSKIEEFPLYGGYQTGQDRQGRGAEIDTQGA
jgi:hypothetical protein